MTIDRLAAALADRYRIERELGAGGMATVYLAHDVRHDRKVAVKVLRPELAAVIGAERFLSEIKTTANLQHPHILPLFDSGAADSFLFYVMPFIDGVSLRDRITREHQLAVNDAVRIATEVASATGQREVYVTPFPGGGTSQMVSRGGGTEPRWSRSGRELFFKSGGQLMAVSVTPGPVPAFGAPRSLFSVAGYRGARNRQQYDVAPGDQRFLMIRNLDGGASREAVYVENWFTELKAKLEQ